jgi:uncharacterized RDD family membrane protein YckC
MTNPYAPPQAAVQDIVDPHALGLPADRGTRLGAAFLDGIIFIAMVYLPILVIGVGGGLAQRAAGDADAGGWLGAGVLVGLAGFGVWSWLTIMYVNRNGQSIAKKLMGIKVVRSDGSRVSLGRLFWLRNVVNGVVSIVPLYWFIDLLFIFSETRQCLHDKIADTIVVRA